MYLELILLYDSQIVKLLWMKIILQKRINITCSVLKWGHQNLWRNRGVP